MGVQKGPGMLPHHRVSGLYTQAFIRNQTMNPLLHIDLWASALYHFILMPAATYGIVAWLNRQGDHHAR